MNVEALKEKARRHEQKEEWQKALDLYQEALLKHDEDEPPDITLYNRVGDIQIRVGQIEGGVESYEKAIELYVESELPNNAIAICKKVLRNLPDRAVFFLRMGQIRASQGFLTDARQNFLTYAELMTEQGDLDAAMDSLVEFVSLSPEDLEIRVGLAAQLESHERTEEAVEQYVEAYKLFILQEQEAEAEGIADKVRELSPETMLPDPQSIRAGVGGAEEDGAFELGSGLGGMELDSVPVEDGPSALEKAEAMDEAEFGEIVIPGGEAEEKAVEGEPEEAAAATGEDGLESFPFGEGEEEEEEEEEEAEPLPTLDFGEGEEEGEAVPTFGLNGEEEEEAEALPTLGFDEGEGPEEEEVEALPTFGFDEEEEAEAEEEEEVEALPTFGFDEEEEAEAEEEEEAEALPTFGFEEEEEAEAEEEEVPVLHAGDFGETDRGERDGKEYVEPEEALPELDAGLEELSLEEGAPEDAVPASEEALEEAVEDQAMEEAREPAPSTHADAAERGDMDLALELVRAQIASQPDEVDLYQRMVEYAFRKGERVVLIEAYMELAGCLIRTDAPSKAKAIYQQVLSLAPDHPDAQAGLDELEGVARPRTPAEVASSEEYVDLGSMILGDEPQKTTRWQVATDAPSGDEKADFAKMLSQFKEKVSEHVDADDVTAHHDLGTAYMEMGLFDEAISEFQMALRASPGHLPTHEVMGRCWMESGQPEMAARALRRALEVKFEVEDELIGIYYLMGRAQEDLGNHEEAVEFYEKVFSLDINFEDVTERLRTLR